MTDPLRDSPLFFTDWVKSLTVTDPVTRDEFAGVARNLLQSPLVLHVLARFESRAIDALVHCPSGNAEELVRRRIMVEVTTGLRAALLALVEEKQFEADRAQRLQDR